MFVKWFSLMLLCSSAMLVPPVHTFGFGDIVNSVVSVGTSIAGSANEFLPTPAGLFDVSKQLIAGYPFEFVSSSINAICSAALKTKAITPRLVPDIKEMNFQLRSACKKYSFPLEKADEMWHHPKFDPKKKVVILATGWTTTVNDTDTIDIFAKAYNCRGDANFVAVDVASFVDTLYSWAAFNTEDLGENIAKGLAKLIEIVPIQNIHLIGHSLGAHIVGAAGRYLNEMTGKTIPRITGLDPAKPCFNEGEALSGLLRGDAEFIDVIHSNPGVLGKRDPLGDVDFYPGGLDPLPTGCYTATCAHARAWEYFAESIYPGNENNFMSTRCTSLTRLRFGKCSKNRKAMGYAVSHDLRGNYFLEVNSEHPFGKESTPKSNLRQNTCGLCNT